MIFLVQLVVVHILISYKKLNKYRELFLYTKKQISRDFRLIKGPGGSMRLVPNNSYKPITNVAWILQKRVHSTRNCK